MATILSLPPEILLQIFEFATDDPSLLDHTPSWRHYDLSLSRAKSNIPWPAPSREAEENAMILGRVCSQWRSLAVGFELRHIWVQRASQLWRTLERLNGITDSGYSVKRITFSVSDPGCKMGSWDEEDTSRVVELLKLCPNLEVFSLQGSIHRDPMDWLAGEIILPTLTSFCGKLKRLHWCGGRPFDVSITGWTSALTSTTMLEALEIAANADVPGEPPEDTPLPPLCLPSLKHLRVSNARNLVTGIAKWALPSLTNLYIAAPGCGRPTRTIRLFPVFAGSIKSLSLDAYTSYKFTINLLAQTSLEQLGIYDTFPRGNLPSTPLPSISTIVIRPLKPCSQTTSTVDVRWRLVSVGWISKQYFAKLDKIVIIGSPVEDLDEPYQIARVEGVDAAGLACARWAAEGVQVVNRRGIPVWKFHELQSTEIQVV